MSGETINSGMMDPDIVQKMKEIKDVAKRKGNASNDCNKNAIYHRK